MLNAVPLWLISVLLFAGMFACYELGFLLHRRVRHRADAAEPGTTDESYSHAGVFGLLALLMAFAFSLSIARHEERRQLVTDEANAIGSFANRLALLPPAAEVEITRRLHDYAELRLQTGLAADGAPGLQAEVARRHAALRGALYAALGRQPADTRLPVLVQGFDDFSDLATKRGAARRSRLPDEVLGLLMVYCLAGAVLHGYTVAGSGGRHRTTAALFFLLLSLAFATILDIDNPRGGFIMVSQADMADVVQRLAAGPPPR